MCSMSPDEQFAWSIFRFHSSKSRGPAGQRSRTGGCDIEDFRPWGWEFQEQEVKRFGVNVCPLEITKILERNRWESSGTPKASRLTCGVQANRRAKYEMCKRSRHPESGELYVSIRQSLKERSTGYQSAESSKVCWVSEASLSQLDKDVQSRN